MTIARAAMRPALLLLTLGAATAVLAGSPQREPVRPHTGGAPDFGKPCSIRIHSLCDAGYGTPGAMSRHARTINDKAWPKQFGRVVRRIHREVVGAPASRAVVNYYVARMDLGWTEVAVADDMRRRLGADGVVAVGPLMREANATPGDIEADPTVPATERGDTDPR